MVFLIASRVHGQDWTNERSKIFDCTNDTISIDSLSIMPLSLVCLTAASDTVPTESYRLIMGSGKIIWTGTCPAGAVTAHYRVFPLALDAVYRNKSILLIQPEDQYAITPYTFRSQDAVDNRLSSTQLNKTGSISRGIGFGNNQDLTVNSTLSLQLSGKLTDKISVLASVTDDNIPIQPDGNTAQIQEFDQVFIQLYDEKSKLTAGDFFIQSPVGYFTRYFKRGQGASFTTLQPLNSTKPLDFFTETSAAISRGKFARNILQGQEGNQGPYRLRGNEGEQFIVVLAGTERIFIDGRELKRGQENDYVIDYNTAEITFTARQLINKDKRIAIDFQYTDANYVRSMVQTSTGVKNEKFTAFFNFFSEQDAKNQPLQQDLDENDRVILGNAGDNLFDAVAPSFQEVTEYTNDQVLYTIRDSLGYDSVFVRITAATTPMYRVAFSEVGTGLGDYDQTGFDATGRIFEWVAPDTVNGQITRRGSFAPIRLLVSPKRNQILMAGTEYRPSEKTILRIDTGFSNTDLNTFSGKGNNNNYSHGLFAEARHTFDLSNKETTPKVEATLGFESIGNNFQPIEPYRSVEFNRNWNLNSLILLENQEILTGGVALNGDKRYSLAYALERFAGGDIYEGTKNNLKGTINTAGFEGWFRGSNLRTEGIQESRFTRHMSQIERKAWVTKIGFTDEREDNRQFRPGTDTLINTAYKFYDWQFYLTNLDSSKVGYKVFYRERMDFASDTNLLRSSTLAKHYGGDLALIQNAKHQFKATISNRELRILNAELTDQPPESTILGRIEDNLRLAKSAIVSNIYYEIGSGLERRQEFIYILDPTGQGPYTWIDYNDNDIKELNEFELARPEDGDRYLRFFTPTDNYERAFSNQFSQSLSLNPANVWVTSTGFKKFISYFSNQSAFRLQRKTRQEEGAGRFNPFLVELGDTVLISQSSSFRNTFFFNRSSSKFGVDYTYNNQFGKTPFTSGFEERSSLAHTLRTRYNFNSKHAAVLEQEVGARKSNSDVLNGRNFTIDYFSLNQSYTYQPGTEFRITFNGDYTRKENLPEFGGETAELLDFGAEARLSKAESGTLFGKFNYIGISYNGAPNSSLTYEMLDGLQNGRNFTWAAGVERTLGKNLQLSLSYNGRKSEEAKSVHTGTAQVRAFF